MKQRWIAGAELVAGLLMLALLMFDAVTAVPYSIFLVLTGGSLVVSGVQGIVRLVRSPSGRNL